MENQKKVAIIGGGLSGLSLAYYLQQEKNIHVTLFEKDKWGGLIQTIELNQNQVELAANGFLGHSEINQIASVIDAEVISAPKKLKRYIFRYKPTQWPLSFLGSLKIIAVVFRFLFLRKSMKPKTLETMKDWGYRVLGHEITDYLLEPAMRGIFAGDFNKLSASVWFQRFIKTPESSGSAQSNTQITKERAKGLVSFKKGMGEFTEKLKNYLKQKNNVVLENKTINDIKEIQDQFDTFVIATAPPQAALILATQNFNIAKLLQKIEMRKIVSVTLFLDEVNLIQGYGCLFPQKENFQALGILWSRDIFPAQGPHPVERWMLLWDGKENDEQLIEKIKKDRVRLYGKELPMPKIYHIQKWDQGLPHMTLELEKVLPSLQNPIQSTLTGKKIFLHGNYLGKMGTTDLVLKSQDLAQQIAGSL